MNKRTAQRYTHLVNSLSLLGFTMNKHSAQRYTHLVQSLALLGFTMEETEKLLKIERGLRRWHELECGDDNGFRSFHIERDETTGKPFEVSHYHMGGTKSRHPIDDREKGALKRLAKILKGKEVTHYKQTDPRGCALYLIRPTDVPEGESVNAYYSRGIAICID
jgi:hypothetical protein